MAFSCLRPCPPPGDLVFLIRDVLCRIVRAPSWERARQPSSSQTVFFGGILISCATFCVLRNIRQSVDVFTDI